MFLDLNKYDNVYDEFVNIRQVVIERDIDKKKEWGVWIYEIVPEYDNSHWFLTGDNYKKLEMFISDMKKVSL